eukprot:scaffold61285_cov30-Tisochrysis_lutea.AAC.3
MAGMFACEYWMMGVTPPTMTCARRSAGVRQVRSRRCKDREIVREGYSLVSERRSSGIRSRAHASARAP